jgi:hypothetical protein
MSEWRLFEEGTIPDFTTREFFDNHPWVSPLHQAGHEERTVMAECAIRDLVSQHAITSLTDLGCGDGDLMRRLQDLGIPMRGYTAGRENVQRAHMAGLNVQLHDFIAEPFEYDDLIVMTEVLEHLLDPHGFLAQLDSQFIVVSSPSAETGEWHYYHHAWAWDLEGYRTFVENAGWQILDQRECDAPMNNHNNQWRPQKFQVIVAKKK